MDRKVYYECAMCARRGMDEEDRHGMMMRHGVRSERKTPVRCSCSWVGFGFGFELGLVRPDADLGALGLDRGQHAGHRREGRARVRARDHDVRRPRARLVLLGVGLGLGLELGSGLGLGLGVGKGRGGV